MSKYVFRQLLPIWVNQLSFFFQCLNHQKSNFALNGAHKNLDCKSCHPTEMRGGKEFQKFSGIAFQSCASCHKDAHAGKFGSNCKACHSEESFQKISGNSGFNHNLTGYKLEGKHKHLDCRSCHDNRNQPPHKFQESFCWSKIYSVSHVIRTCTMANLVLTAKTATSRSHFV